MATNKLFTFGSTSNNILTDIEYQNDSERNAGNSLGAIARSKLVNKVLKQCAAVANAIGQLIVNNTSQDASDSDPSALATNIAAALKKVYVCESLASGSSATLWMLNIPDLSSSLTTYGVIVKTTISCGDNMSLVINNVNAFDVYKTNTTKIAAGDIVGTTSAPMAVLFIVSGNRAYYVGGGGSSGIADELAAHIADTNNPHQVTSTQVNCFNKLASIPIVKGVWDTMDTYKLVVNTEALSPIVDTSNNNLLNGGVIGVYFDTASASSTIMQLDVLGIVGQVGRSGNNVYSPNFSGLTAVTLVPGYVYLLQYLKASRRWVLLNYQYTVLSSNNVGGQLGVANGGTGATSAISARSNLRSSGYTTTILSHYTLAADAWEEDSSLGAYTITIADSSFVVSGYYELHISSYWEKEQILAAQSANMIAYTLEGSLTIIAYGEKPTIDINVDVEMRRDTQYTNAIAE